MEHYFDRWERLGIKCFKFEESETSYWYSSINNKRCAHKYDNPVTMLNTCNVCGLKSTPKRVNIKGDIYGWNFKDNKSLGVKSKDCLCMSCWNKIKALTAKEYESVEIKRLTNKLLKEARKCQK